MPAHKFSDSKRIVQDVKKQWSHLNPTVLFESCHYSISVHKWLATLGATVIGSLGRVFTNLIYFLILNKTRANTAPTTKCRWTVHRGPCYNLPYISLNMVLQSQHKANL